MLMVQLAPEFKVKRQSLASEVAKKLSLLIQDGTIPPGMRLLEIELANQLGVSRGPVREALRILETMGLAESIPGHGTYTAMLSKQDASEIYALRILLETEAVGLVCCNATDAQFHNMEEILKRLFLAAKRKEFEEVAMIDIEFHRKLWESTGNRRLAQVLEGLITQARRYLTIQTLMYQSMIEGVGDHSQILEALIQRNKKSAQEAMRHHLEEAAEAAAQNIPETTSGGE